jgi:hypothetical protein
VKVDPAVKKEKKKAKTQAYITYKEEWKAACKKMDEAEAAKKWLEVPKCHTGPIDSHVLGLGLRMGPNKFLYNKRNAGHASAKQYAYQFHEGKVPAPQEE